MVAGTGLGIRLDPGEEMQIGVLFCTASARPELGYALPPGRYLVRTAVPIYDGTEAPFGRSHLSVDPVGLTVVERAS